MKNVLQMRKDNIMKQYIKYICLFLVLGMSAEIWANTETYTFTAKSWTATDSGDNTANWTGSGEGNGWTDGQGIQLLTTNTGEDGITATSPTSFTNVTKVVVTYNSNKSGGAGSMAIKIGTNTQTDANSVGYSGSGDGRSADYTSTFNFSPAQSGSVVLRVITTTNSIWVKSVEITYTPADPCTVTFNAEGGSCDDSSLTEASGGAGVVLPEATADCSSTGWGFYGWATTAQSSSTTTTPTIVGKAGDRYYPAADITLHAVYAKGTYTKVTSTSEITSGAKYLIAGDDPTNKKFYIMGDYYFQDTYYYMEGHEFGTGNDRIEDSYQAAAVYPTWRYIITGTTDNYVIKDNSDSKYVDVWKTDWYTSSSTATNTITFGEGGYCTIANNTGGFLVVFIGGDFGDNGSAWDKMLLYKETTTPSYWSSPTCKTLTLAVTPVGGGTATFDDNSSTTMDFGGSYSGNITAIPSEDWDFIEWVSSNESAAIVSDDDDPTTSVLADNDATVTAHFYQHHTVTYTLTGVTKTSGVTTVTKDEMTGFDAVFALSAHYKSPLTYSVSMGGTPLTEDEDYEWNAETKTLSIVANINDDIEITITATAKTYTDYRFSCAELTLTAKPVTAGVPIFITSAASKKVRSQDSILIVGNGLTPSASLTFPSLAGTKFEVKSRLGGDFTIKADGTIDTVAYIFYTPDAEDTSDGLDKLVGITASVGGAKPKADTLKYDIIGRHLPNKIVIAAKGSDNKWYALPSYMQTASTYNVSPQEISVDNVTLPTKAYSSSTNRYNGIEGPTLTGVGNNLASGNSQYVRLIMDIHVDSLDSSTPYAPLYGQKGDGTKVGRNGQAQPTNNLSEGWWWLLTQTNTSVSNPQDAKYTIKCANNAKLLRLWEGASGGPKWGLYTSGISELRLIPMEDGVTYEEAYMVEWGQHSAIVEVDPHLGYDPHTQVKAKLNGTETGLITLSQTLTSVKEAATKYNYTVNFGNDIDFAAAASNGAMLTLEWYNSDNDLRSVSNITVPKIIAANSTMSAISTSKDFWADAEVHVLPGVTLEADANTFSNVTIDSLLIYPNATVKVTGGTLDVKKLTLRNGWTRVGSKKYDAARLQIKSTANLTHTRAYIDWYIDNDQFYPMSVPFPVTVSNIKYLNSNSTLSIASGSLLLRYYDGASRAEGKSGNWKYYDSGLTTLVPSVGYAMAAKRPVGKAFSIVHMPMTFDNAWTTGGEKGHYTDESVPPVTHYKDTVHVFAYGKNAEILECNKGWNLIGNPYMAVFHGDEDNDGIYGKLLAVTNKDDEEGDKVRYITIPNSSFTDYTQVNFSAGSLKPGSSFLIQAKDTCRLEFSNSKIDVPSAPARYTTTPAQTPEQEVYIRLSSENSSDLMGLVIGEDYTAAYETNADLMKMLGELNTLKTYMIYDSIEMAFVAINSELAQEWIPVTVRIPESNQYTFSMRSTSVVDELEGVYLIDYQTNTVTNLIENDYSFTTTSGTISGRFAINAIVGERQTPTDIDIIHAGGDIKSNQPFKFIYNDKVFILHNGIIYDSTGKKVREIKK